MKPEEVIQQLRDIKILTIQDYLPVRGDHLGLGQDPKDYPYQDYLLKLQKYLGIKLKVISSKELIRTFNRIDNKDAEELTIKWINEAEDIKGVKKKDIIRASKLYFSLKRILKKYKAYALTMASWGSVYIGIHRPM